MSEPIELSCHCGNVRLEIQELPDTVRDCDCAICNRLGALWGDFKADAVKLTSETPTKIYHWTEGDNEMHHCGRCGCTTHYFTHLENEADAIGINFRMLDRRLLERIPVTA